MSEARKKRDKKWLSERAKGKAKSIILAIFVDFETLKSKNAVKKIS